MGILCVFLLCPLLYDLDFYAFSKWLVEDPQSADHLRHLCSAPSGSSLSYYHTHIKDTATTLVSLHILHSMEYSN